MIMLPDNNENKERADAFTNMGKFLMDILKDPNADPKVMKMAETVLMTTIVDAFILAELYDKLKGKMIELGDADPEISSRTVEKLGEFTAGYMMSAQQSLEKYTPKK